MKNKLDQFEIKSKNNPISLVCPTMESKCIILQDA